MKVNILEAHDRMKEFTKKDFSISECCQNLIDQRPFGDHPFYIFAHTRTEEDGFTKRLIWQPRLTKPKSQTNSMLFKAYPGTDQLKVIWILPTRELWNNYKIGMVTQNKTVLESIDKFENHRIQLDAPEDDDLSDEKIDQIYRNLSIAARSKPKI